MHTRMSVGALLSAGSAQTVSERPQALWRQQYLANSQTARRHPENRCHEKHCIPGQCEGKGPRAWLLWNYRYASNSGREIEGGARVRKESAHAFGTAVPEQC